MRINYDDSTVLTTTLYATLAREAALLVHRLRLVLTEPPLIDVTLTYRAGHQDFVAHLLLRLTHRDLPATGEGTTPGAAIRDAFDALTDAVTPCILAGHPIDGAPKA